MHKVFIVKSLMNYSELFEKLYDTGLTCYNVFSMTELWSKVYIKPIEAIEIYWPHRYNGDNKNIYILTSHNGGMSLVPVFEDGDWFVVTNGRGTVSHYGHSLRMNGNEFIGWLNGDRSNGIDHLFRPSTEPFKGQMELYDRIDMLMESANRK